VVALGVVDAVGSGRPGGAAVAGGEDEVEGAHRIAVALVVEPDVEPRQIGALRRHPPGLGEHGVEFGVAAAGARRVGIDDALRDLPAVELQRPGGAAIGAVQDDAVVPDGPAALRAREVHRGEVDADRHRRLPPARAVVVGQQHMAALPDRHQA
jgi:hypothetical protein